MSTYALLNPILSKINFHACILRENDGGGDGGGDDGFQGPNADGSAGYSNKGDVSVSSGGTAYGKGEGGIGTGTSSGTGYTSFADMFDGGGPGKSGDTYGNNAAASAAADANNDGYVSAAEAEAVGGLSGGIDGDSDSGMFGGGWDIGPFGGGNSTGYNDNVENFYGGGESDNTASPTSTPVATDPVVTDPVVTDPVVTDPVATDPVGDNTAQVIADLQAQLDALSNQAPQTQVVYGDTANNSTTSLPDDYLTEEDLARYFEGLDLNSNAYDPAAFLNAYGFALQPGFEGDTIQTYLSPDGLYMRRAVRDRDTGEIRYINVPIGSGALNGNAGLGQWRQDRRTGFGTFV